MNTPASSLHPNVAMPSAPSFPLPPDACDAHAHIFGPYASFPLAGARSYSPPEAPLEAYLDMLDRVGFARGVLVHASAYGLDCSLLIDALKRAGSRLRGVAVAAGNCGDAELASMQRHGVRGLRFTQFDDPAVAARFKGSVGFDQLEQLGPRLRRLGLHAQLWSDAGTFARASRDLLALDVPLCLDHMSHYDVARGTQDPAFQTVLGLVREGRIWVKMSVNRNTKQLPGCEDVRPFHDALVNANPARLVWGSDWPYLGMGDQSPDVGVLLNLFDRWTPDRALRHQILVANPAALYGF
jgi:2-pyrone-4,6-dicarboxylate lactonase